MSFQKGECMSKDKKLLTGSEMTQQNQAASEKNEAKIDSTPIEVDDTVTSSNEAMATQDKSHPIGEVPAGDNEADLEPEEPVRVIPKHIDVEESLKNPVKRKGTLPNIVEKIRDNRVKYATSSLSRFSTEEEQAFNDRRAQVAYQRLKDMKNGIYISDDDPYDRETLNFQESYLGAYAQYRLPSEVEAMESTDEITEPKIRAPDEEYILNENRNMTLVFCDLVNSSKHVDKDSEEGVDLMRRFQKIGGESMEAHGGQINNRNGDGFVGTFGFRLADENETLRAIKAALLMLEKAYDEPDINIRLAIHLGNVSTGMDGNDKTKGGNSHEVLGRTVHECARMEGVADPNTVCVGQSVANLLCEFFHFELIEERYLKGLGTVPLFQAVEPTAVNTRFDVQVKKGLTPFVCQSGPYDRLQDMWDDMPQNGLQFLTIEGDPGVGKSRLVYEFVNQYKHDHAVTHYVGYCMVERRPVPFGVFMAMMEGVFAFKKGASETEKIKRVEEILHGQDLKRVMPVWINMLKIKPRKKYPMPEYTHNEEQEIFMKSMMDWMIAPRAEIDNKGKDPYKFVLQIENFEHIDHSSWELLEYLIDHLPKHKQFFLILNVRSKLNRYKSDKLETLFMEKWSKNDSLKILENVYKQHGRENDLTPEFRTQFLKRSGYNPLLIEDLAFFYIDGPTGLETIKDIPLSVMEILTYRIMRLGAERNLLKQASLFGEHIPIDFLEYNFEDKFKDTEHAGKFYDYLELLLKDGIIDYSLVHRRIQFRHGLHQDATMHTFRRENWKAENRRIGDNLIDFYGKKANYVAVAAYYTKGVDFLNAVHYYEKGGIQLVKENAYDEIIDSLPIGLEVIEKYLPNNRETNNQELSIRFSLAKAYAVEGGEEDEIFGNLSSFECLVNKLNKPNYHMFILVEKARLNMMKNRFTEGAKYAQILINQGKEKDNKTMILEGYTCKITAFYYSGDMKKAYYYAKKSVKLALEHDHKNKYALVHPMVRSLSMSLYPFLAMKDWTLYRSCKEKLTNLKKLKVYSVVNECCALGGILACSAMINDKPTVSKILHGIATNKDSTPLNILESLHRLLSYWIGREKPVDYLDSTYIFQKNPYTVPFETKIKVEVFIEKGLFKEAKQLIDKHFKQTDRAPYMDAELLVLKSKILISLSYNYKNVLNCLDLAHKIAKEQSNLLLINKVKHIWDIMGIDKKDL
jgi:class 3 adenylate cyclase